MANITARETAFQVLRKRIIKMDLKPGAILNDKELAEELGMSRTPVREALIMLSIAKLVVVRPQSGTYVAPIDADMAEEEQFARFALEKEVIHRIGDRLTPLQKSRYEENLHLYQFYSKSQVPGRESKLMEVDSDFHRIAFLINDMERHYIRMKESLQHVERLLSLSMLALQEDHVYEDHLHIVDGLFRGDTESAEYFLEVHLNRYRDNLNLIRKMFPQYFV